MENRERQIRLTLRLSNDENYILEQKRKASNMKSKSSLIRHLILYGYVYDVNYDHLREYNTTLSRISNNLNQIAKRMKASSFPPLGAVLKPQRLTSNLHCPCVLG
jgi:uncharacterized Fe-S radical SAM superfamily protein PflX